MCLAQIIPVSEITGSIGANRHHMEKNVGRFGLGVDGDVAAFRLFAKKPPKLAVLPINCVERESRPDLE